MKPKEIAETTFSVLSCCCEPAQDFTDSERCGKGINFFLLVVSLCFGIADSATDWIAWAALRSDNFGLVQAPDALIYPWLACTLIGTVLLVLSLINDVTDFCSCSWGKCQRCGCNSLTCSEFMSFSNTILQDLPLLTLACAYITLKEFCLPVDPSIDVQKWRAMQAGFRELYISGVVTTAAIIYRTCRSFGRLCYSYDRCCGRPCCCPTPPDDEKLCPKETCVRYCCVMPYYCSLFWQMILIFIALTLVASCAVLLSNLPGVFGDITTEHIGNRNDTTPITRDWTISGVGMRASMLVRNGHLSVTQTSHTNLCCLAYLELHPKEIVFNIARINKQRSDSESCVCNPDSTCDHYYGNLHIEPEFEAAKGRCPLQTKTFQRDRNLHINCSCTFS